MISKWLVAPFAVLGAFVVAGIAGALVMDGLGFWDPPGAGFCAAAAVVCMAYFAAPRYQLASACVALVLGAVVAWLLLEPSSLPERRGDPQAYQPTHIPVVATYLGGVAGLLTAFASSFWSRLRDPMATRRRVLLVAATVFTLASAALFYSSDPQLWPVFRDAQRTIVAIEAWRTVHHALPASITDVAPQFDSETGPVYYTPAGRDRYTVSFGRLLGESYVYDSSTGAWQ